MSDLQGFFESMTGKGLSAVVILVILLFILILGRSGQKKTNGVSSGTGGSTDEAGTLSADKPVTMSTVHSTHADTMPLALSSMLIAVSFVLSNITLFHMPQGGTVTPFSMLPIAICSYLIGTRSGVMAGTALGMLNLIVNPYVIHPLQLLLDYPIAFAALGMGGPLRNTKAGLPGVYLVGIFGRFVCSTLSGVVFFASYAEGTGMNPLLYSVVYNGTYIGAEGVITLIVLLLPPVRAGISKIKTQLAN